MERSSELVRGKSKRSWGAAAVALSFAVAFNAQAEGSRVLVVMKDAQSFKSADVLLQRELGFVEKVKQAAGLLDESEIALFKDQVSERLEHIQSLVVEAQSEDEIESLKRNPAVAYVEKEMFHPAPRPARGLGLLARNPQMRYFGPVYQRREANKSFQAGPRTPWGIHAVKAMAAWPNSRAGEGVRVLVLDTGIDKDHPALAGNFEAGQDFVNDNVARPYPFADTVGHGTHVAGTIAAVSDASGFTGVAPKARLLAGRVCSTNGCSNISIAKGVNWGVAEKVDVINMSLGGMWSTPAEREAIARAEASGVVVIAASGNGGTSRVSFPAALPQAIAVGAVDVRLARAPFSQYGPELAIVGPGVDVQSTVPRGSGRESDVQVAAAGRVLRVTSNGFDGSAEVPTPVRNVLVYAGLGKPEELAQVDVRGKFALIMRGDIKFSEKVQNAMAVGAAGVLIYNNEPGLVRGAVTQDGSRVAVPVFGIEQAAGESIRQTLAGGQQVQVQVAVVATDYASFDGTSMATPHVAGVAALIRAAGPSLNPAQVRELLRRTAIPLQPNQNNELGAGLVNADVAVRSALSFERVLRR